MRYVVYGAGAIGGSLAAHLVEYGRDVVLVDRDEEHVAAINERGLRLSGPGVDITARARALTPDQVDFPLDAVLLSVKSQHTADAMAVIAPRLSTDGYVVSLQNGLNEQVIAQYVGIDRVIGALVNWAADYESPGRIQYGGASNFVIGELSGGRTARVSALAADLYGVFDAEVSENVRGFLWSKQVSIAVLFATGITHLSISECLDTRDFQPAFAAIASEGIELADKHDVHLECLDDFDPALYRERQVRQALTLTADHYRSLLKQHTGLYRDLAVRRRVSEVEGTIGRAVDLGADHGLPMPAHRRLLDMVHEIERGSRALSVENLHELAAACGEASPTT